MWERGSGCIAISLALATGAELSAWDVSAEAIQTAEANAKNLGARVEFTQQDLYLDPNFRPLELHRFESPLCLGKGKGGDACACFGF
jgi:tRNA1(Val) A37 N6-methylase TrmN6